MALIWTCFGVLVALSAVNQLTINNHKPDRKVETEQEERK